MTYQIPDYQQTNLFFSIRYIGSRYRDYKIVIEHSLNIYEKINDNDFPIYTICGLGRTLQGSIQNVKDFIDYMYRKYS